MSLDAFLPPYVVKPKTKPQQEAIIVEEKCARCRKPIKPSNPRYTLNEKGKEKVYCRECAQAKLHKRERKEEEA